ncbi:MAG: NAD(P)/FAD-dependent oxidoreductase [Candidatus Omnitrophica bacterium]|nr:NAD(P)/FAD-dependent oxidoreductase [Candidatus Omnitrophota bacterium]
MERAGIVIIGAGVVGLGIAAKVSEQNRSVYVLERHKSFGQETSSRNSEVIHGGIYYDPGSLKAKACVEGNRMLYEICAKNKIPYRQTGKLIVAVNDKETSALEELLKQGGASGARELKILTKTEIARMEPNIKAEAALFSPATGIIDSHSLMKYFVQRLKDNRGDIAYDSNVAGLRRSTDGYEVAIEGSSGDTFKFHAKIVINSAGLESDNIAKMAGINIEDRDYRLKYCKGQYFRVNSPQKCGLINRLIYPVPENNGGLGVHATLDLAGGLRLGPDSRYVERDRFDYNVDVAEKGKFLNSAAGLLPFLEEQDLVPDTAGIRPKLQGKGEGFRDFVIQEESRIGFPGLINLIGIESPGLTAAPAIAEYVEDIVERIG